MKLSDFLEYATAEWLLPTVQDNSGTPLQKYTVLAAVGDALASMFSENKLSYGAYTCKALDVRAVIVPAWADVVGHNGGVAFTAYCTAAFNKDPRAANVFPCSEFRALLAVDRQIAAMVVAKLRRAGK